jgi:hypothetical protein
MKDKVGVAKPESSSRTRDPCVIGSRVSCNSLAMTGAFEQSERICQYEESEIRTAPS